MKQKGWRGLQSSPSTNNQINDWTNGENALIPIEYKDSRPVAQI